MAKTNSSEKAGEQVRTTNPQTFDEFMESGWEHYSKEDYPRAEADYQQALTQKPDNADTLYALGMAQQAGGKLQEAVKTFEKVIQLLQNGEPEDKVRAHMLVRLAQGHINRMLTGDWGLSR